MKKLLLFAAASLLLTAPALAADSHMKGKMPADHKNGCASVMAKTAAMLKAMPDANSRTYRMAKKGEKFTIVMDGGRVHHWNGWWLVKAANGYRYWVHQSVISCQ